MIKSLGMMEKLAEGFARAMDDDFNSRDAVAKILAACREIPKLIDGLDEKDLMSCGYFAVTWLEEYGGAVLGLLPNRDAALTAATESPEIANRKSEISSHVEELLVRRAEAREAKDWDAADSIRDELNKMGVVVTDTAEGPKWDLQ